ncbi:MAG: adenine phosphoribosyltransferase [Lachnospiraceae bacterium]|nr:adenine phosphoribosyltransferase [Lachnospiraceae bacterium]
MSEVEKYITSIPDFPEPGIIFRDITTVVLSPEGLKLAVDEMGDLLEGTDFDVFAGLESRGFIFGTALAYKMGKGIILIRKKGKLPRETVSQSYDLEYGKAEIEVHKDDVKPGDRVVLVDDLIATGGTLEASIKLIESLGAKVVKVVCLIELAGLKGRQKLGDIEVGSVLVYDGK